jgi:hypothetical protein
LNSWAGADIVEHAAVSDDADLTERLGAMLRRQRAPAWALRALGGDVGQAHVSEEGDSRLVVAREDGGRLELEVRVVPPPKPAPARRPWKPRGVNLSSAELRKLSYLVIDEIVEDNAALSVSPWPAVDDRGRLVFADEPALAVQASVSAFVGYLGRADFRSRRRLQTLRMGDAFAARVRRERLDRADEELLPPRTWLVGPVYDIHSPARDKAKEAFYAAVAPTLKPDEVKAIERAAPPR